MTKSLLVVRLKKLFGTLPGLIICLAALLINLGSCTSASNGPSESITPFTSDKCSYYAEGPIGQQNLWCHCCVQHDIYYWMGGTEQQRRDADAIFRQCIRETGATANAKLMWLGVRLGGGPVSNASHRWGFGWPANRPYKDLTTDEESTLSQQLSGLAGEIATYCSAITEKGILNVEPSTD